MEGLPQIILAFLLCIPLGFAIERHDRIRDNGEFIFWLLLFAGINLLLWWGGWYEAFIK
jgi:hypothetical protein